MKPICREKGKMGRNVRERASGESLPGSATESRLIYCRIRTYVQGTRLIGCAALRVGGLAADTVLTLVGIILDFMLWRRRWDARVL